MKKKTTYEILNKRNKVDAKKISRKEAIRKLGKCAALTAATLTFLSTKASAAGSIEPTAPGW